MTNTNKRIVAVLRDPEGNLLDFNNELKSWDDAWSWVHAREDVFPNGLATIKQMPNPGAGMEVQV